MKQQILNWNYTKTEMSLDAYVKQMTEDGSYYLNSIIPVSYGVYSAGAFGPSHYMNITKAILILNKC